MAAGSLEVTVSGPELGEIVSRGALMSAEGQRLADFRQTTRLWFGSPVVLVEIEIEPHVMPEGDPWHNYYAARFAWSDSTAELARGVGGARERTEAKRLEAPQFVEITTTNQRTAVLTAGLPYHRRVGFRMLDSILICPGEQARSFRLGVGIDVAQPALAAMELIAPDMALLETAPPPQAATGWFFHVDAKNVAATHWEPLAATADHAAGGFRARLIETAGQAGTVHLRSFRSLASARQLDFQHQPLVDLTVEGDKIVIDITAFEWIELEAFFS
jgi:alpha-mannosidase